VVYGVLLRPLPYRDADALAVIQAVPDTSAGIPATLRRFGAPELADWAARARAFQSLALASDDIFAVGADTGSESVLGSYVSDTFFDVLGQPMALGRPPRGAGMPDVVVRHRFWQRQLGGTADVVGREIRLNGQPFTITGVAGGDFELPTGNTDVWTSLQFAPPAITGNRRARLFALIGRLRPGIPLDSARAEAQTIARSLAADYPESNRGFSATVVSLRDHLTDAVRPALVFLFGAVGLVFFLVCVNVTNLLLVRGASRSREVAVRVALGASRGRLVRHLLAEGLLLACAGAAAGIVMAHAAVALLLRLQPEALAGVRPDVLLPRLDAVRIDAAVMLFALAASLAITALAAVLQAAHSLGCNPARALTLASRGEAGGPRATAAIHARRG
ncbi:MAG: ABC transporter permease, partial [Vicinamibacterales bacterium]